MAGASHACGVTHIALSLAVYLNAAGVEAYYADGTSSSVTQQLCRETSGFREKDMILYHHHFSALMNTGNAVEPPVPPNGIRITDAGCDLAAAKDADLLCYVVSSRPWQERGVETEAFFGHTVVLVNPANRYAGAAAARATGAGVYGFPLDEDPFYLSSKKKKLFERMLVESCGGHSAEHTKNET